MELSTRDEGQIQIVSEGLTNPFAAVKAQYAKANERQTRRMLRQKRDFYTVKERKALQFYTGAAMLIEAL